MPEKSSDGEQAEGGIGYVLIRMENRCVVANHVQIKTSLPWHNEHVLVLAHSIHLNVYMVTPSFSHQSGFIRANADLSLYPQIPDPKLYPIYYLKNYNSA